MAACSLLCLNMTGCDSSGTSSSTTDSSFISGIDPALAFYNDEGECGTGAVVPWAGKLWVITYGPHRPFGSSDKLYEITPGLNQIIRSESIGGTPANRMIHRESRQLFIGPYVIDTAGNVRVIPYQQMPGRLTGNARHLTDPAYMIYYGTMEEGLYEVNVHSLKVKTLYVDKNLLAKDSTLLKFASSLPGTHGKGLYSGQGVVVYSNNGEPGSESFTTMEHKSGVLAEWDGQNWKQIRRNQFTEVTGPGGIYGNNDPETDPLWSLGWDSKSVLLAVRYLGEWSFYRLPKASHSYDGPTGWNTEWPRIRNIGSPVHQEYLMTMHGMFWHFPGGFNPSNTAGIRPLSAYLKVIGDFAPWQGKIVFGCDDAAFNQFLNKRQVKGTIAGPGQSNSNLWFVSQERLDRFGPRTADGAVWLDERIRPGEPSEPYLFSGWDYRMAWLSNEGDRETVFRFEADQQGNGNWTLLKKVPVLPGKTTGITFEKGEKGEWIRVSVDRETTASVMFNYSNVDNRGTQAGSIFDGLAGVKDNSAMGGLLWSLGNHRHKLGVLPGNSADPEFEDGACYQLDSALNLVRTNDPETSKYIRDNLAIPTGVISLDDASVLVIDDLDRRWRLPRNGYDYDSLMVHGLLRICREVVTERDLFDCAGTFYELPAENADGFAKIRPIASHQFRIRDYASYRGMLVMTGIDPGSGKNNKHIIRSGDGKAAVWTGVIDDLWELGRPAGIGGPWKNSPAKANSASDPYLIGFYETKNLQLSHQSPFPVKIRLEVDPMGNGKWMSYKEFTVPPGETIKYEFPAGFQARWIRFVADADCIATAWLIYS